MPGSKRKAPSGGTKNPRWFEPEAKPRGDVRNLDRYREMRSAERTPEPFGAPPSGVRRPQMYCIQKHAARRMHYDLRLEWKGVLLSWAVPQGPSLNPDQKSLAVHTEDHPVEYGDFEGKIPEGNYGAGAVIVWDRGRWTPIDDPDKGLVEGKLHFMIHGAKLGGEWILVRLKNTEKEWLLFKKNDSWADPKGERSLDERSVLSGLLVQELRDNVDKAAPLREMLDKLESRKAHLDIRGVEPMLAQTTDEPFSDPSWVYEIKVDGYRLLCGRDAGGDVLLRYRSGLEATSLYPEIALALSHLPFNDIIIDGEVCILDEQGRPDFQRLQRRGQLRRRLDIERATVELPATLYAFDLVAFEGYDLRALPLTTRKAILKELLPPAGALRYSDHIPAMGEAVFAQIVEMGLEGMMAKKADSPYRHTRSADWQKILAARTGYFAIVGYTLPKKTRTGLGALHLAFCEEGKFVYAGRAGSGFTEALLDKLRRALDEHLIEKPGWIGPNPTPGDTHAWVEPRLVCRVRYKEFTNEGLLRHPVFLELTDDVAPESCTRPQDHGEAPAVAVLEDEPERVVHFTRLEKIFWPHEGYTKGDLIEYYRAVSPWLLPYLADRPVVLTRYPDGIEGKSFFQKDAPDFVAGWVRTERMWSENAQRDIDYFVAEHAETLLYLANLGTIPLHIWSSRVATLGEPDWSIIDLDPKGAPFKDVVRLALAVRALCEDIGLPCFVKTSGSTGMHVLLPLGQQVTYEQSRMLANLVSVIIANENPDIATVTRNIADRGGRVYLDFLQNGHGRLLVAPFSVRPRPGATVSTPLHWDEVTPDLDPDRFTIKTVPARFEALKADPLRPVLDVKPDLAQVVARLSARISG